MKNFIVIIFAISLIGCNNHKRTDLTNSKAEVKSKELLVEFYFKTDSADEFKIMINDIKVDELQRKDIHIYEDVVPSSNEDRIIARFDENNISDKIRISLGNKVLKKVELKRLLVKYGDNEILLSTPADFKKYLFFNKFIEYNSENSTITTLNQDGVHHPVIFFKPILINLLNNE